MTVATARRTILNLACGDSQGADALPQCWRDYEEITVDVDASYSPQIVASMTDLSAIESESVDVVWCRGAIEHLYDHEVPTAMKEMYRVLKPGGELGITTVDIEKVCRYVAQFGLGTPMYRTANCENIIHALDMLYGHRKAIRDGHEHMAHRSGFSESILAGAMKDAGFANVHVKPWGAATDECCAIIGIGEKILDTNGHREIGA